MQTVLGVLIIWFTVSVMVAAMYPKMRARWERDKRRPSDWWKRQPP